VTIGIVFQGLLTCLFVTPSKVLSSKISIALVIAQVDSCIPIRKCATNMLPRIFKQ